MKISEFINHKVLNEFTESITTRQNATIVLDAIGFPRGSRPRFPPEGPQRTGFWLDVCRDIEAGLLPEGTDLQILVDAAANLYPMNPVFNRFRTTSPAPRSEPPHASREIAPQESNAARSRRLPQNQVMTYDVFISYSRQDSQSVVEVHRALLECGVTAWLDQHDLKATGPFTSQLEEALQRARLIVICIGPHGIGKWQKMEINVAIDWYARTSQPVIPVLLDERCTPDDLPPFLRQFNAIQLKTGATDRPGMARLVSKILEAIERDGG